MKRKSHDLSLAFSRVRDHSTRNCKSGFKGGAGGGAGLVKNLISKYSDRKLNADSNGVIRKFSFSKLTDTLSFEVRFLKFELYYFAPRGVSSR